MATAKQKGIFIGFNPEQEAHMLNAVHELLGHDAELNARAIKHLLKIAYDLPPDKVWKTAMTTSTEGITKD